ncbi:chromosome segregation and condensation protein ScpA [Catenulispora acidiphila DSM 44928]|uniref:Segregation and condensation protein A n=1 Tax=Catenulispora acidiphila (strain DSM 44928 / JCM 14897 / NBRC 102108 / NRRL B-24433 / ID139908) TaxID=479433 RepID=C7PVY1_CATAD|nr:segregation/condensation protein A [Catenulispora acidiphila]ACU71373.1 chromosome segregation and condensation protein ScpA [Catenulispora acidiphila DSM 44928]
MSVEVDQADQALPPPADAAEAGAGEAAAAGAAAVAADPATATGAAEDTAARVDGFQVSLPQFEGPFDLLLGLIAKHKLDVTTLALSKVTDEFIAYIRAMGDSWDLDQASEFLVIAATLLDLKAARLLPAAEVEDEGDLALLEARDLLFARLLQYKAYKQVATELGHRHATAGRMFPRAVKLEPSFADLLPEVIINLTPEQFAALAVKAMTPKTPPEVYVTHLHGSTVSVREQVAVLIAKMREYRTASFDKLCDDAPDTLTIVARFLGLLELFREAAVMFDQSDAFAELTVRWTGTEEGDLKVAVDEFDRSAPAEDDEAEDEAEPQHTLDEDREPGDQQ